MDWVVRLTECYGQYRVTLPRELIEKAGFEDVKFVELRMDQRGWIIIGEYRGKRKEKGDLPDNRA